MGHGAPGVSELHASRRTLTGLWRLGGLRRWIAYRRRHRFGWFGSRIRNDVRLARRVGRRWRFDRLGAVRMQGWRGRGGVVWHVGFLVFFVVCIRGEQGVCRLGFGCARFFCLLGGGGFGGGFVGLSLIC
jgi:hypothetical protein